MKEAYGGILNLVFIIVFLTIVIGLLGFVFSYTKAFKFKNIVIDTIERYEGSGCSPEITSGTSTSVCRTTIWKGAEGLSFNPPRSLNCPKGFTTAIGPKGKGYYCYSIVKTTKKVNGTNNTKTYAMYKIMVQTDIEFPIIDRIMGMRIFQVSGDTKEILLRG